MFSAHPSFESRHRIENRSDAWLGETTEELFDTLADLLDAGCQLLTLGQYLQPRPDRLPVVRYLPPEEFEELGRLARQMGFKQVPAARSSVPATTRKTWPKPFTPMMASTCVPPLVDPSGKTSSSSQNGRALRNENVYHSVSSAWR